MNSNSPESSGTIDELASLWAVRLEGGDLTEIQCAELDTWLITDSRHRTALTEYCQLSTQLEAQLPQFAASLSSSPTAPDQPGSLPTASNARPRPRWWIPVGIALATAACFAVVLSRQTLPTSSIERVATSIAQRESLTLADGTIVDLNAHTSLTFDYSPSARRVRMGRGQAFFAVTKDINRPFIVDTPLGSVRVTGTAFDVRTLSTDSIAVTVAEGSVEVRLGENEKQVATAPIQLSAHDQLSVNAGEFTVRKLSATTCADEFAWQEGLVVVQAAPLSEVLQRFAHYHGLGISATKAAAHLTLTGRFKIEDLNGFLLSLETIHPVRVLRDQSGTIRVVLRD
jgi:transmembrane sensor